MMNKMKITKEQIMDPNNSIQEEKDFLIVAQSNEKKDQDVEDPISFMNQRTYDCNEEESVQTTLSKDKIHWEKEKCMRKTKQGNINIEYNEDDKNEGDNSTTEDTDMLKYKNENISKLNNMELNDNEYNFESESSVIIMIEKKLLSKSQTEDPEIANSIIPLDHLNTNVKKAVKKFGNKSDNRNKKTIEIIDMEHLVKFDSIQYEMDILKKNIKESSDIMVPKKDQEVDVTHVEEKITEADKDNEKNEETNLSNNEEETNVGCDAKSIHTENYILYDEEDIFNENESYDRLFLDESINLKDTNESVEIVESDGIIKNKEINDTASASKIEFFQMGTNTDQSLSVSSSVNQMYIYNYERFAKTEEEEQLSNLSLITEEAAMIENPNYQVIHHVPIETNFEINQIFTNNQGTSLMQKNGTSEKHPLNNNEKSLEINKKEDIVNVFSMNEQTIIHYYKSATIFPFKKRFPNLQQINLKNVTHIDGARLFSFDVFIDEPNKNKLAKCYIQYLTNENIKKVHDEPKINHLFYYNINLNTMEQINRNYKKIKDNTNINKREFTIPKYYKPNRSQSVEINYSSKKIPSNDPINQGSSIGDGCSSIIQIEAAKHIQGNANFERKNISKTRRRILSENSLSQERGSNCICTKLNHMLKAIKNKLCFPFHKENYEKYFKDEQIIHTGRYKHYNANRLIVPHKLEYMEKKYSNMVKPNKEHSISIYSKNKPKETFNKGSTTTTTTTTTTSNVNKMAPNGIYNDTHMSEKNHSHFDESNNRNNNNNNNNNNNIVYETTDYVMLDTMNNTNGNMENASAHVTNMIPQNITSYNFTHNKNARNNYHMTNLKSRTASKSNSHMHFPQSSNHIIKNHKKNPNKILKSEYNKNSEYTYSLNEKNCKDIINVNGNESINEFSRGKEIKQLYHPMEERVPFHQFNEINRLNISKSNNKAPIMISSQILNLQKNPVEASEDKDTLEKVFKTKSENPKRFNYVSRVIKYVNDNKASTNHTNMFTSKNNKNTDIYDPENIQYYYSYSAINENLKKTSSEKYNNVYSIHDNLYKNDIVNDNTSIIWTPNKYNQMDFAKKGYFTKDNIQKEYSQKDFIFKKVSQENTYRNRSNTNIFFNSCCSTNVSMRDRSMCAHPRRNIKNHTMENLDRININY